MKASFKEIIISFCVTINFVLIAVGFFQEDVYFLTLGIMNLLLFLVGYIINRQFNKLDE